MYLNSNKKSLEFNYSNKARVMLKNSNLFSSQQTTSQSVIAK